MENKSIPEKKFDIEAIIFRDEYHWIIQGKDYDICIQGHSSHEVIDRFKRTIIEELNYSDYNLDGIKSTVPKIYKEIFNDTNEVHCRPYGEETYSSYETYKGKKYNIIINLSLYSLDKYIIPYIQKYI